MNKLRNKRSGADKDEVAREYDLQGKKGVRGKYYQAYREGHTVRVYEADGTAQVRYFTLAEGAVMLEPDVRAYFPDSESVNRTLRALIQKMKNE